MQYVIGFVIALFIALTGVGAGTITVPVLVLFLGVPAPVAVSIGLMFSAAVKLILVPAQIARRNVAWRTLGYMLLGGAPGVLVGSLFLQHLMTAGSENTLPCDSGRDSGGHRRLADLLLVPPHAAESRCARGGGAVPCFFFFFFFAWRRNGRRSQLAVLTRITPRIASSCVRRTGADQVLQDQRAHQHARRAAQQHVHSVLRPHCRARSAPARMSFTAVANISPMLTATGAGTPRNSTRTGTVTGPRPPPERDEQRN